jgi:DNA-binding NarL/FixJ family response regulator
MIRIMIVTKHAQVRDGLCTILRLADSIEVTGAVSSLSSAIRQACTERPDVALVDLEMPEDEGYETIRQLQHLCAGTKAIALTAHDYPAARDRAMRAGASRVIVKGMELPEMVAALRMTAGDKIDPL